MLFSKSCLGIDIGSTSVRMVEVKHWGREYQVSRIVVHPLADHWPEGDEAVNAEDKGAIETALKECLTEMKTKSRKAVLALSSKNVITRQIRMPEMPEDELHSAIRWEVERYIPLPIEDLVFDYVNQGIIDADGHKNVQLMLVAAPKNEVIKNYELLQRVGLQAIAVETAPFSLCRLYSEAGEKDLGTFGCLDIGVLASTISIIKDGTVQFVRSIPVGSKYVEDTICQARGVDNQQAREIMISQGAILKENEPNDFATEAVQLDFIFRTSLNDLVNEVRRSIDFYKLQSRDPMFTQLILSGGLANLSGIDDYFGQEIGVPVSFGDLPQLLQGKVNKECIEKVGPDTAVALGLALREVFA